MTVASSKGDQHILACLGLSNFSTKSSMSWDNLVPDRPTAVTLPTEPHGV